MTTLHVRGSALFEANLEVFRGFIETRNGSVVGEVVSSVEGNLEIQVTEDIADYLELCSEVLDC